MRLPILVTLIAMCSAGSEAQEVSQFYTDLARETLASGDGWASFGEGTSGGSAAGSDHVFVVSDRNQLAAALIGSDPKIIFISGTIHANVDEAGEPLGCADYAAGTGYTLEDYLTAFAPESWGRRVPSGLLEDARAAAANHQKSRIRFDIPSNTTLIGLGDAQIVGASFWVNKAQNVIIRNIRFDDAFDCFPQWDPTDGSQGNWNSSYDNLSLTGAVNVWVDHCEFSDGDHPDESQPSYFGRHFQWHDGALDVTNASDLITVSWSHFRRHDKVMLIGGSDNATTDAGKLRVTLHHNWFDTTAQRTPRVRYGQVHVYNNYYLLDAGNYGYTWGVGVHSEIYAQNNFLETGGKVAPSKFISDLGGTAIYAEGTQMEGGGMTIDAVAAYNVAHNPDLSPAVSWTPWLFLELQAADVAADLVKQSAGVLVLE